MRLPTLIALIGLFALGVWSQAVLDRPFEGGPLRNGIAQVIDGDSLRLNGEELRLKGIDAPEYAQTCRRGPATIPCGKEAATALRRIIARAPLTCTGHERDRYGRILATCRSLGADVAAMMVRIGMAVSFGNYLVEEVEARNAMIGLWAGDFEMPSEWRAAHRDEQARAQERGPAAVPTPPQRP